MTHIRPAIFTLDTSLRKVRQQVGNTPLVPIQRVFSKPGVQILAKLEWQQLGGSVKSRPAFQIIEQALLAGKLRPGMQLLDATSGNTGIAYAAIGAALGIQVTLCLPENASLERKRMLLALGAHIIPTSRFEGTDGAQEHARQLYSSHPDLYFYADQYNNDNNWKAHLHSTGPEIWEQTRGKITHFIAGLGTTGTFTGVARSLKILNPGIQTIALQPSSPMHGLEGWKHLETAIVPGIYDPSLSQQIREIDAQEALDLIPQVAAQEGLLLSPSAAANLLGAIQLAKTINKGVIVTSLADDHSKYAEVYQSIFKF